MRSRCVQKYKGQTETTITTTKALTEETDTTTPPLALHTGLFNELSNINNRIYIFI